ncbi:MAG: hypothetical protein WCK65_10360 [Rhodospirillaceae bacterium]
MSNVTDTNERTSRFALLDKLAQAFIAASINELGLDGSFVSIDMYILCNIVDRYFVELEAVKMISKSSLEGGLTRAALTAKLISRLRPISVNWHGDEEFSEFSLLANERFAIFVCFSFLDIQVSTIELPYIQDLEAIFRYSNIDTPTLVLCLKLLKHISQTKPPEQCP